MKRHYGCGGPPDNGGHCEVCGLLAHECFCPPCPSCGDVGNPICYAYHEITRTPEQIESFQISRRRRMATPPQIPPKFVISNGKTVETGAKEPHDDKRQAGCLPG